MRKQGEKLVTRSLLALVAFAVALATSAPATAIRLVDLEYFDNPAAEFKLPLNAKWRNTKLVALVPFSDYPVINSNSPQVVWAPTCKPGRQLVEFRKTVTLPGKPAQFEASALPYLDGSTSVNVRMKVFVNGTPVLNTDREVHKRPIPRSSFKLGKNIIKIQATKPANVACSSTFGITAFLFAKFRTDVRFRMVSPLKGTTIASPRLDYKMTVRNLGPSTIPAGYGGGVYFKVGSANVADLFKNGIDVTGIADKNCSFIGTHDTSPSVTCLLSRDLPPGGSQVITFTWYYDIPDGPEPFKDTFDVSWQATGYQDPTPNTVKSETRTICTSDPVTKKCVIP